MTLLGSWLLEERVCEVSTQQVALDEVRYDRSTGTRSMHFSRSLRRAYISMGTAVMYSADGCRMRGKRIPSRFF